MTTTQKLGSDIEVGDQIVFATGTREVTHLRPAFDARGTSEYIRVDFDGEHSNPLYLHVHGGYEVAVPDPEPYPLGTTVKYNDGEQYAYFRTEDDTWSYVSRYSGKIQKAYMRDVHIRTHVEQGDATIIFQLSE